MDTIKLQMFLLSVDNLLCAWWIYSLWSEASQKWRLFILQIFSFMLTVEFLVISSTLFESDTEMYWATR